MCSRPVGGLHQGFIASLIHDQAIHVFYGDQLKMKKNEIFLFVLLLLSWLPVDEILLFQPSFL